jgi:ATP-dependent DNA helicase RecG
MLSIESETFLSELEALIETTDVECKAAQGRDGRGEIPTSIWETYSAMANTSGGDIYLGIEETVDHRFICRGITDIQKVKKTFWDTLHGNKVNKNILNDNDVQTMEAGGMNILHIHVRKARRQDRPIYIGTNPMGNTYVRRHEGDYRADDETVKRMLAEAIEDSRDDRILELFWIEDLEQDTLKAYRNRFSALKPDHPWINLPMEEFLLKIGALGKDRQTGKQGVRLAGLLMFGRYDTIKEQFPYYMIDYQERPEPKTEARWIDRIIPDGTWSGNLFDFHQKVIRKLTSDLKIPFRLQSEIRIDDTLVHQALREALTNALIHADYSGRVSVLIVKRPDMFGFRNPGTMRVTIEQALAGGLSDCRNHRLQDFFRYAGLGEHAGSGVPGILQSWRSQHWRMPLLYEDREIEQTLLELRMSSLLPEDSINNLQNLFGDRFQQLPELHRIALVTAEAEGFLSHTRLRGLCTDHPKDISAALTTLVKEGFLEKKGETRASIYYIKGTRPKQHFAQDALFPSGDSPLDASNSPDLNLSSPDLDSNSPDLNVLLLETLKSWGYDKMPGKIAADRMEILIIKFCTGRWLQLSELASLLERDPKALQDQYLSKMLANGKLRLKYPESKNHPMQAYRTQA